MVCSNYVFLLNVNRKALFVLDINVVSCDPLSGGPFP